MDSSKCTPEPCVVLMVRIWSSHCKRSVSW